MPTVYENLLLAGKSYKNDELQPGQQVLDGQFEVIEVKHDVRTGYDGVAFRNTHTGEIIIAHTGTEFEKAGDRLPDIINNFQHIADSQGYQQLPSQFYVANDFVNDLMQQYPGSSFSQTGHSLGAILAELVSMSTETPATTFDSPGSLDMAEQIFERGDYCANHTDLINSYLADRNVYNSINGHAGTVHLLLKDGEVNWTKGNAKSYFSRYSHFKEHFNAMFTNHGNLLPGVSIHTIGLDPNSPLDIAFMKRQSSSVFNVAFNVFDAQLQSIKGLTFGLHNCFLR